MQKGALILTSAGSRRNLETSDHKKMLQFDGLIITIFGAAGWQKKSLGRIGMARPLTNLRSQASGHGHRR